MNTKPSPAAGHAVTDNSAATAIAAIKPMKGRLFKGLALVSVGFFALTACTNASENTGQSNQDSSGSQAPSFDPTSVSADSELAAQVPAAIRDRGKLIVGSNTEYPPAEFVDTSGKTVGYDIDLITAVAKKLDLDVEIQSAEFTAILPALGPKYDVGVSSFTVTSERLQTVNMVSFLNVGTSWAVQSGNPKNVSLDNLCGLSVGVQTGTIQEDPDLSTRNADCEAAGKPAINVVTLQAQTDITTRLTNGSIDAMAADSPVVGYAIKQTDGALEQLDSTYDQAPQAMAVAKDDLAFAELLQKTLTALKDDGSYKKALDAWGSGDASVDTFEVNPQVD